MKPSMRVVCNVCGEPVDYHCTGTWDRLKVEMDSCKLCSITKEAEGYARGFNVGVEEGKLQEVERRHCG